MKNRTNSLACRALALAALTAIPVQAQLRGQLGVLDLTANDGINPATGVAWAEGDSYRLIFLSSTTTDAMSPDIATYNAFVQETAEASTAFPELGNATWTMMGSTLTVDARDNTGTNPTVEAGVPVFLMDGVSLLALDNTELWSVPSAVPVTYTENGEETLDPGTRVFTGSFNDGTSVGPGAGGGSDGDGTGSGDTALGVLDGQGVQTGQPVNAIAGRELEFWIRQWKHPAAQPLPVYAISEPLTVIEGVSTDLLITAISYDPPTRNLRLTFNPQPDRTYLITYSTDMIDWSDSLNSDDLIQGGEEAEITASFDLSEFDLPLSGPLFFRVEETGN